MDNACPRKIVVEVDLRELWKEIGTESDNIYKNEMEKLVAQAERLFPGNVQVVCYQDGQEETPTPPKSILGTVLAIMVATGITAKGVSHLVSAIAELIRAVEQSRQAAKSRIGKNIPHVPQNRVELNGILYERYEAAISVIRDDIERNAADTDPVFQKKEIIYHIKVCSDV